ncbi:MAG: hypothetical protein JWQ59_1039 [Cryobacterium sp.]|nr:hypothetical protein [Cryobacterium sp.]
MNVPALDALDELDRRIIVALQEDGRATWRAIAGTVNSSTGTVARRGQQLLASGVTRIAVVPALGSKGQVDSFLIRINCQPGTQLQVAAELVNHEGMRFVTIVTGGYDIIAELVVHGGASHYPRVIEDLQSISGVERWRSDLIMHVYKVTFDWGRQLFAGSMDLPDASSTDLEIIEPAPCGPAHFDNSDWKIIEALADDGRESFQAIAAKLGMSESSVRRRFDRLRSSRCIDILTLMPATALGMGAETLLTVRVAPRRMDAVAKELSQHPAVRYLAATLDENSLFCEVILPSTTDLHTFITSTLSRLEGVKGWTASMELLYMKRGFVETPWWRSQVSSLAAVP